MTPATRSHTYTPPGDIVCSIHSSRFTANWLPGEFELFHLSASDSFQTTLWAASRGVRCIGMPDSNTALAARGSIQMFHSDSGVSSFSASLLTLPGTRSAPPMLSTVLIFEAIPGSRRNASARLVCGPLTKTITGADERLTTSAINRAADAGPGFASSSGSGICQKASEFLRHASGNALFPDRGTLRPAATGISVMPNRESMRLRFWAKTSGCAKPQETVIALTSTPGCRRK